MTGEVYGSSGYIFKAQMAFLASYLSPRKSGPAKRRDVREAISSKNACLVECGKFRHAAAHFARASQLATVLSAVFLACKIV